VTKYLDAVPYADRMEALEREALRAEALRNPVLVEQYRATIAPVWLDAARWPAFLSKMDNSVARLRAWKRAEQERCWKETDGERTGTT
jgi:hypothetical protein